ncbi:MAG: SIS domain-containing protein [Candidatus Omnitrophica bacterium]|nr:SIS domain-containing protein [Candidatus Omnitrophota bacterium]
MEKEIKLILKETADVIDSLARECSKEILLIAKAITCVYQNSGKVLVFGNGGSAADSQHMVAELVGRFKKERRALAAIALTTNTSIISAWANDYSYDSIFARQIEALGNKEDIVIGISTSGQAKNVIAGLRKAGSLGIKRIALTGANGSNLKQLSDICLIVPSENTPRIQEAHIATIHIICQLVEDCILTCSKKK